MHPMPVLGSIILQAAHVTEVCTSCESDALYLGLTLPLMLD